MDQRGDGTNGKQMSALSVITLNLNGQKPCEKGGTA